MLDEGLDSDPEGALGRATARIIEAARRTGMEPSLKLTAAFADGEGLLCGPLRNRQASPYPLYRRDTKRRPLHRVGTVRPRRRQLAGHPALELRHHHQRRNVGAAVRAAATRLALAG
jgi:hypothetical protein